MGKTMYYRPSQAVFFFLALLSILALMQISWPVTSQARISSAITSDGTLGTIVTQSGSLYSINGGTIRGQNQFHSFGLFSVGTGEIASFGGPNSIANVFGRVTGGVFSSIDGTIQTTIHGANLFFMNPAGIVFGPNATLNVSGSVAFTTADYLRLEDGVQYNAIPNIGADVLLSSAPVAAYGFLNPNPEAMTVLGSQLAVSNGQGIDLVGGNLTVEGVTQKDGSAQGAQILAPGGQIHLASVASPGEVLAGTLDLVPNIKGESFGGLGSIQVSQQSVIVTSGDGGGTIRIRGGRFVLDDSTVSANVTGPAEGSLDSQPETGIDIQVSQDVVIQNAAVLETNVTANVAPRVGSGGVRVKADHFEIRGDTVNFQFTGIRSDVATNSIGGKSGDIEVEANTVFIRDFGQIQTVTVGSSDSGNIFLKAMESLKVDTALVFTGSQGQGNSGSIFLEVKQQKIHGSLGKKSGRPHLEVRNAGVFTQSQGSGNSGNINVTVEGGDLSIREGGGITAQSVSGGAGNIDVNIDGGDIFIDDGGVFTFIDGNGTGGNINISAENMEVKNPGGISVNNFSTEKAGAVNVSLTGNLKVLEGSTIDTISRGPADAGDLTVNAKDILISGPNSIVSTQAENDGNGGNLKIMGESIQVTNKGVISATSKGLGNAGSIDLISETFITIDNGAVTTEANLASGGNISLMAPNMIRANNSQITSSVQGGPMTAGGDITIDPDFVVLQNSQIIARAAQGQGGNISITTDALLADANSTISASSQFGVSGTVIVQSPTSNLSEALSPLPEGVLSAAALLRARCAARKQEGNVSSFTEQGRDSLPTAPSAIVPSPLLLEGRSENSFISTQVTQVQEVQEWNGKVRFESVSSEDPGRYILTDLAQVCSS